ncbi:hypothetical protein PTTG_00524 [Puccinia triticina 1-1 BBBD Race 1]|uniref:OTU domain-containing protein n=2 Tax=Puccinia triticina TaxID=208348 RepID=A0A0C4EIF7_PUCT1|nr:hypothetical protein PTTG_00524 [Puccinia triticina 1-1 BBBD Race 1]
MKPNEGGPRSRINAHVVAQGQPTEANHIAPATNSPSNPSQVADAYLSHSSSSSSATSGRLDQGSSDGGSFSDGSSDYWSSPRHQPSSRPAPLQPSSSPPHLQPRPGTESSLGVLERKTIATFLPRSATWVPIDYLPGYATTQGFIKPDGNCMFRAFAHIVFQDQEQYAEIKQKIVDYIKKNSDEFVRHMDGPPDLNERLRIHLQKLDNGGWGGPVEQAVFERLYQKNHIILIDRKKSVHAMVYNLDKSSNKYAGLFLRGEHYELLAEGEPLQPKPSPY